ncbi:MAG: hypothetical protein DRI57_19615 [Deltaproteobacteria bacterium]|nr:MAG: hypothetical protein DRI57_19615 [Deltaproteobacteria bacterium]
METIGIPYEKVELACKLISDILGAYDNITLIRVKIESFDDHAFELRFVYRILGLEKLVARHKIIDEINLAIIRQFKKQSIEFAIKPHVIVSEGPDQENRHETLLNSAVADPAE